MIHQYTLEFMLIALSSYFAAAMIALSDPVQLALISSVPATLAAMGAIIVGLSNRRKSDENGTKLTQIHELTNSNLSKVTTNLDVANEKIAGLQKMIESLVSDKKTLQSNVPQKVEIEQPIDSPVPVTTPKKSK